MAIKEKIKQELLEKAIKVAKPRKILFLVESGSRLWGFESKDSDYDLRGFFIWPIKQELSLKKEEYFEYLNKEKFFDLVLFHINKAFMLLSNSNPSVIEWLQAKDEDVYFDEFKLRGFFNEIKELISKKKLFVHYLSMASKNWNKYFVNENKQTIKKILYIIRGLLNAKYIMLFKDLPSIKFEELIYVLHEKNVINKEIYKKILELIKIKKKGFENEEFKSKLLEDFIKELFYELNNKKSQIIKVFAKKEEKNQEKLIMKINEKLVELKELVLCKKIS